MNPWLLTALIAAGTYRATRLVVCDSFPPAKALRDRLAEHGPGWLGELVTCPWCASAYVGAVVVALTDRVTSVPLPVLTWLAAMAVTGLIGERDDCS